jgi:hypothetical protein
MEFLDINLTKDLSHAFAPNYSIHSPFYWRILKKIMLICEIKNLESVHEKHCIEQKMWVGNQTKTQIGKNSSLCPGISTKVAVKEFHLWKSFPVK